MSFLKKTWLARIGVGLNRFRMNNSTDVVLESNPISVTQQGDQLSADNMNDLETRIGNAFDEMAGNLAPIEVSPATTNHSVGSQIVYNGILYKVTSAISTGDNLVVGTNISAYPVSSAISDISEHLMKVVFMGQSSSVQLPAGETNGIITFSSDLIDSKYVSKNGAIFTLQAGIYISIVQVRWNDMLNCNLLLSMTNSLNNSGWDYQNYRLSSESICLHSYNSATTTTPATYIDNSSGGGVQFGQLVIIKVL